MIDLLESVRKYCPDLDPALMERHFQSLPVTYFERYAPADISRHLHLIAGLADELPIAVELRPFAAQTLEAVVVGFDHPGALSCIAAALAARGFSLEDVQVSTYLDPSVAGDPGPRFFLATPTTHAGARTQVHSIRIPSGLNRREPWQAAKFRCGRSAVPTRKCRPSASAGITSAI